MLLSQGHLQYRPVSAKATYNTGLCQPRPPTVQACGSQGHLQYRPVSAWVSTNARPIFINDSLIKCVFSILNTG